MTTTTCIRATLALALLAATTAAAPDPERDVAINEIHGWGGDWVELYNAGAEAVDLAGWRVTDCDEQGRSRMTRALAFPRGTTIPARSYLLVVSGRSRKAKEGEVQRICAAKGATRCFRASWRISQKGGDTVRLIAPDGRLLSEAAYPPGVVARTRSWSRLPNGSGEFGLGDPTPGRDNAPAAAR